MGPLMTPEDRIIEIHKVEKDETGLSDFHKMPDIYGIDIDKVGINRFRIPLKYKHRDGTIMNHDTVASMYIHFPKGKAGINMSRLYEILQEETEGQVLSAALFKRILERYRRDMRDSEDEPFYKASYLKFKFNYALKQPTLKSGKSGWQYYPCEWEGVQDSSGENRMFLTIRYEYSSTCPCSLTMSKQ